MRDVLGPRGNRCEVDASEVLLEPFCVRHGVDRVSMVPHHERWKREVLELPNRSREGLVIHEALEHRYVCVCGCAIELS